MATRNGAREEAKPGSILLVIHDFVARSADELSLAKGDRIELIERDDDFGDGWFLGRHMTNGNTGLFPEVYTTPAPKGTLTQGLQHRRVSEGLPKSAGSDGAPTSPTQQRHSSASVMPRPASAASAQPASASLLAQNALRTSLPSVSTGQSTTSFNANSPVMNETLSVIDEHITDMNTPRSSFVNGNKRDTMGSVYSQPLNRMSYIPGHETDEDEQALHTEDEVMAWSPARVAEYLEDQGVERAHCDVFKEQEISGEVLLAMDQSSIFIKEFELGPVGRRLKTWHKVKALQDEVRRSTSTDIPRSTSEWSAGAGATDDASVSDAGRNRSSTMGTIFPPRGLEPTRQNTEPGRSNTMQSSATNNPQSVTSATNRGSMISPLQSMTSMSRPENTYRPSAHSIRTMNHSRRHSSIDSTSSAGAASRNGHRKQPSLDQKWQPGQPAQTNGKPAGHAHALSAESPSKFPHRESSLIVASSPDDLERGYFSSNELDNRNSPGKKGNVLTKKVSTSSNIVSPIQSRANSFLFGNRQSVQAGTGATADSAREPVSPLVGSAPSNHLYNSVSAVQSKFGSSRSATSPQLMQSKQMETTTPGNPVVTKLEPSSSLPFDAVAATAGAESSGQSSAKQTPSSSNANLGLFGSQKQNKPTGLRAISDAITNKEKVLAVTTPTSVKDGEPATPTTRTGSTTPSTETRSFDLQKSMDGQSRTSTGSAGKLMPPPTSTRRPRPKTKKATSAYTRGLEKKTPAESMAGCDYSGWMKKKSGSLMSTWKPRLFILRGRRLSYYYKEDDTEEKGLIDISFHRVLPAQNETLTGLHASITGAAGSPTSPTHTTTPTAAQRDLKENPPKAGETGEGLFIFKLVPPKSGLAKGVTFTKPTVHYFAVNSRQEGRLWMAALMKATIDRDDDGVVTTTYNQKTISLAKARARRERPPALKEEDTEGRAELDGASDASSLGLGIGGLPSEKDGTAVAGAEKENNVVQDGTSSITPSMDLTTTGGDILDEKSVPLAAIS